MRKDIIIGLALLAAPIIAIAQNAPTPPDEPANNSAANRDWGNSAVPVPAADDPQVNGMIDGEKPEPPPELRPR
ncbi:hypothetical protein ACFB49_48800 [Sphingomonas sp. DBB INV C78]|uniref:hypothetical protein n=1 Tax=Sphingomonas sp. DBB INV C78 TaxID=3349434 RepID=UPI0036D37BF9